MRQTEGVILEAIYYDVVHTSSTVICVSYACRPPASTYEADAVIVYIVLFGMIDFKQFLHIIIK